MSHKHYITEHPFLTFEEKKGHVYALHSTDVFCMPILCYCVCFGAKCHESPEEIITNDENMVDKTYKYIHLH